jgi:hypothetical protein
LKNFFILSQDMGGGESKKAENTGVNQNVMITNEEPINFHNHEMLMVLYAIAAMKAIELIYFLKKNYKESTKEKIVRTLNNV